MSAGSALTFAVNASDPDGNTLTYSASRLPSGSTFTASTHTFAWTPTTSPGGNFTPTFTVSDGTLSASTTATITVHQGNRAPVITAIPAQSVVAGNALTFTVSGSDPDGNTLTYSASGLPSGATFNTGTHIFAWTPTTSQTGTFTPTFTVSDGSLSASTAATITVTAVNQNQAPVITPIATQTVTPGNLLSLTVKATDPNGNPLTYTASNIPSRAVFRPDTQDFLWVPTSSQIGTYSVTFSACDGAMTTKTNVTMIVRSAQNSAPVMTAIPAQSVKSGISHDLHSCSN